ncbi:unnamed protein product [Caenorhabditis bovis]|nr:unnamed protein product [Caenorhabditis bovis]
MTELAPLETSQHFLDLRAEYLAERNMAKGIKILERLVTIDPEKVTDNAWLYCKDLMTVVLEDMPFEEFLVHHQILLLSCIPHSPARVNEILARIITKKLANRQILSDSASAVAVAFARRIDDTECFEAIAELLGPVAGNELIVQELKYQLDSLQGIRQAENRFRIYQVLIEAMKCGKYHSNLDVFMSALLNEVTSTRDVLTQLNALDVFADLMMSGPANAKILLDAGVPQTIYNILQSSKTSPDGGFLFTGCVRFFGHLARHYPEVLETFPEFLPYVTDMVVHFDLLDASQRVLAFDTFANVAYTEKGKEMIELVAKDKLQSVLQAVGAAMNHGPIELRCRHVQAGALLFQKMQDETAIRWYTMMGGDVLTAAILAGVKKPFIELCGEILMLILELFNYPSIILAYVRFAG